jgi:hypothetical protein
MVCLFYLIVAAGSYILVFPSCTSSNLLMNATLFSTKLTTLSKRSCLNCKLRLLILSQSQTTCGVVSIIHISSACFYMYVRLDPRVAPLIHIVKAWARQPHVRPFSYNFKKLFTFLKYLVFCAQGNFLLTCDSCATC